MKEQYQIAEDKENNRIILDARFPLGSIKNELAKIPGVAIINLYRYKAIIGVAPLFSIQEVSNEVYSVVLDYLATQNVEEPKYNEVPSFDGLKKFLDQRDKAPSKSDMYSDMDIIDLRRKLQDLVDAENYDEAAAIRDELRLREKSK